MSEELRFVTGIIVIVANYAMVITMVIRTVGKMKNEHLKSYALLSKLERDILKLAVRFKMPIERLKRVSSGKPLEWERMSTPVIWLPTEIYRIGAK